MNSRGIAAAERIYDMSRALPTELKGYRRMTRQAQTSELRSPHLLLGDCAEEMRALEDSSIDAIVTDPPYALTGSSGSGGFMGAKWDSALPTVDMWREALRVAKPGAYLLAFGGTRTYHRLACAIEDAGWEVKDCIMWVHSQGFPKGQNVAKQVEALLKTGKTNSRALRKVEQDGDGASYQVKGRNNGILGEERVFDRKEFAPETDEAKAWEGWNTQLKPAVEPIVVARKPLDGTVATNVLKYGTGAINIDACRVPTDETVVVHSPARKTLLDSGHKDLGTWNNNKGRFPANLIHDGSDEVLALFPNNVKGGTWWNRTDGARPFNNDGKPTGYSSSGSDISIGSAARFFYCAKASRKERDGSDHPTMKPLALMRYLVRLVTRKGGVVLDPFMGSGTTGVAAIEEGMHFVGMEKEPHYYEIASRRIRAAKPEPPTTTQQELPL